jgi:hypothetical protein
MITKLLNQLTAARLAFCTLQQSFRAMALDRYSLGLRWDAAAVIAAERWQSKTGTEEGASPTFLRWGGDRAW